MSVFRVEKNKNFTAMSNYHFRDPKLSLKAVGLLSKMLSLPDDWDYSQAGLAKICKDGKDCVRSTLKELEENGYLVRERVRGEGGRMEGVLYHVYEVPQNIDSEKDLGQQHCSDALPKSFTGSEKPMSENPTLENPTLENPTLENPMLENPMLENPMSDKPMLDKPTLENHRELNTKQQNTKQQNTKYTFDSINQSPGNNYNIEDESISDFDGLIDKKIATEEYLKWESVIKEQINYEYFVAKIRQVDEKLESDSISLDEYNETIRQYSVRRLDSVVSYIVDFLVSPNSSSVKIGNDVIPREIVKKRILSCDMRKIRDVITRLNEGDVKNPKAYAIAMLYNA